MFGRLNVWTCGRRSPLCCSRSLRLAAGSTRKKMDQLRRSHSYCPSRLSRSHQWLWHSLPGSWILSTKHQRGWTPASIAFHSPPLLFLPCQGSAGSRQGGLARWQHLCEIVKKKRSLPLTLAAAAFYRAKWWVHWRPESGSGRIENTSNSQPTWILAMATAAVISMNVFIFAIVSFGVCAGAARGG